LKPLISLCLTWSACSWNSSVDTNQNYLQCCRRALPSTSLL
jgi:hypothetical protein